MTKEQEQAIKCAYSDLIGALNDYETFVGHDWDSHALSISDLEEAFPDVLKDLIHKADKDEDI
jgi:hypothetical protein